MAKGALQRLFGNTTRPFRQVSTFLRKKLRGSRFVAPVEPHSSASMRIDIDLSSIKFDSSNPRVVIQGLFTTSSLVALLGEFVTAFSAAGLGRGQQPLVPGNEEVKTAVQEVDALWPEFQKKLEHALDVVGDGVSERHRISPEHLADICDRAVKDFVVVTPTEEHPQQYVVHTDVPYTFAASSSHAVLAVPESDNGDLIAEVYPAEHSSTQYVDFAPQWSQHHTHAKSAVDSLPDVTTVEYSPLTPTDEAELPASIPVLSPPSTPRRKLRSRKCTISDAKTSRVAISESSHPTMHSSGPSGIRALGAHNRALEPLNYQGFSSTFSGSLQPYDHISDRTNMKHRTGNGSENQQPPLSPAVARPALRPRGARSSAPVARSTSAFPMTLPQIAELHMDESSDMEVDGYF